MSVQLRCRAVLFDLDGVLVDSYEVWFHLLNQACRQFGSPPISRETFRGCWGQGVQEDLRRFFPKLSVEQLVGYYDAHFMDHANRLRVEPQARQVTRELRARGLGTALVTNTPHDLAEAILSHAALSLDVVVGGTDVAAPKPAPDMVTVACERLGVTAAQACVVGDSSYDAEAAAAAGVRFVGYRRPGSPRIEALGQLLVLTPDS